MKVNIKAEELLERIVALEKIVAGNAAAAPEDKPEPDPVETGAGEPPPFIDDGEG